MNTKSIKDKILIPLLILAIVVASAFVVLNVTSGIVAQAIDSASDVLDDLRRDENFTSSDFPSVTDSNDERYSTVQVFQVAEGSNHDLFLYAYQPADSVIEIELTHVNMWDSYSANNKDAQAQAKLYELELVSTYEVFDKYKVKDYEVSDESKRYYNIVSVYTPYNSVIHGEDRLVNGETNYVAIKVAQQWCAYYFNDNLVYEHVEFKTMEIRIDYDGELLTSEGLTLEKLVLNSHATQMLHYVSFSCDEYTIARIYDADMTYTLETTVTAWTWSLESLDSTVPTSTQTTLGEPQNITLYEKDTVTYQGDGLFAQEYKWNRILPSNDTAERKGFVSIMEEQGITFTETAREKTLQSQWTFAFAESEYTYQDSYYKSDLISYQNWWQKKQSRAVNIGILRLHFVDDRGYEYNLGVVSDLTSSDGIIDGIGKEDLSFIEDWLEIIALILGILIIAVLLAVCAPFITPILNVLWWLIKMLVKGVWAIVSLPFKAVGALFKGNNKGRKYR